MSTSHLLRSLRAERPTMQEPRHGWVARLVRSWGLALALGLGGSAAASANLLENGDFAEIESAPPGTDLAPIVGWVTTGTAGSAMESRLFHDGDGLASFNGDNTPVDGAISQDFPTVLGEAYVLSFEYGMWVGPGTASVLVEVRDGATPVLSRQFFDSVGTPVDFTLDTTDTDTGQILFDGTGSDMTLRFTDMSSGTASLDLHLDNVVVVAPEPSWAALWLIAAGAGTARRLAVTVRRRR